MPASASGRRCGARSRHYPKADTRVPGNRGAGSADWRAYADYATLRGDPSDGLPGVAGVGDKTAAALVRTFGSVEAILDAIDKGHGGFPAGARPKVAAARDYLAVAPAVVRVAADAPVPEVDGGLPVSPVDPDALTALDARFGLGSSLRRAVAALSEG